MLALSYAARAAARELHAQGRLARLPAEVPAAIVTIQLRPADLIADGLNEFRLRSRVAPRDVLAIERVDVRKLLDLCPDPEERIAVFTNSRTRLLEEAHAATPDVGLPGIPSLPALLDAYELAAGALAGGRAHGIAHVAQVASYGLEVADADADLELILLFAVLHDAMRHVDGLGDGDEEHGEWAATLAREWNASGVLCLSPARLEVLATALAGHAHGRVSDDPTIGACWDADRLALRRFGIELDPSFMSTRRARDLPEHDASPTWGDVVDGYIRRSPAVGTAQTTSGRAR